MIISHLDAAQALELAPLETNCFPERERWSLDSWRAELIRPSQLGLAARAMTTGQLLGAAVFGVQDETADLLRIAVDPAEQRRGIARKLVMTGLDWAASQGATRMLLEVREHNESAERLYRDFGFVPISIRKNYYGPGSTAIVMQLELAQRPSQLAVCEVA